MKKLGFQQLDDWCLVQLFKQGNEAAFDEIMRRYYEVLNESALHLTDSTEDAQEIVNNTFLLAFRNLHTFRGESSLSTWLHRILRNQAYSLFRMNCRRGNLITQSLEVLDCTTARWYLLEFPDWRNLPEKSVFNNEIKHILQQLMTQLPPVMLQTARLYFIEQLSCEAIAQKLDCPSGTVRSRIFRIRQILSEQLQKYDC